MNEIYYEDVSDDEEEDQKEDKNEKIKINGNEDTSPNNENINKSNEENKETKINQEDNNIKEENSYKRKKVILYNNIDYLLEFLISPEETKSNYVLRGYFYEIIKHLIDSRPSKMIPYLLDYPLKNKFDIIDLLVQNMNRKSIAKIVIKLLLFDVKEVKFK